jgi:hypothetical protein
MKTKKQSNKPDFSSVSAAVKWGELTPRAEKRLRQAVNDENIKRLSTRTVRCLVYACRDPKTTAKDITQSQKVMKYVRLNRLWEQLAMAVRLYDSKINLIKIDPEMNEDCGLFRARWLKAILGSSVRP